MKNAAGSLASFLFLYSVMIFASDRGLNVQVFFGEKGGEKACYWGIVPGAFLFSSLIYFVDRHRRIPQRRRGASAIPSFFGSDMREDDKVEKWFGWVVFVLIPLALQIFFLYRVLNASFYEERGSQRPIGTLLSSMGHPAYLTHTFDRWNFRYNEPTGYTILPFLVPWVFTLCVFANSLYTIVNFSGIVGWSPFGKPRPQPLRLQARHKLLDPGGP